MDKGYFTVKNKVDDEEHLYFGEQVSSINGVIVIDGVELDKSKHPLVSRLNTNLVLSDWNSSHQSITIDTNNKWYRFVTLAESLQAGK